MGFILVILMFFKCSWCSIENKLLFEKIANHKIIYKKTLEKQLPYEFKNYENKFIGTGNVVSAGHLLTGVFRGKRNDTIYDILIVYENNKYSIVKENPYASFYYGKENTINKEYMLGRIYTTYKKSDTSCIKAYIETIQPFKVDTLNCKFRYGISRVLSKDSLEFCSAR